ncbi:MAG: hypothetical protein OXG91_05245, partial [bacterium]|nr:hypothetical protein [bacterium]
MLADVMADGVLHLRRLGPVRDDPGDVLAEGGVGDAQRSDLLAEVQHCDVLVDQSAHLLGVLVRIEFAVGGVPVAAPGPHLDLSEQFHILDELQRLGPGQDGVEGREEGTQRDVEGGPQLLIGEQLHARLDGLAGFDPFDTVLDEDLPDPLALRFELLDLGSERTQRPLHIGIDRAVGTGVHREGLGELRRHAVVVDGQPVRLLRRGP